MNIFIAIGYLGRDVSISAAQSGAIVGDFSIGETDYKNKTKDGKGHTNWLNVKVFGELANNCKSYISKGSKVHIVGRLEIKKYTAKDGTEKSATSVIAESVMFLDKKVVGEIGEHKDSTKDFSRVSFENDMPF